MKPLFNTKLISAAVVLALLPLSDAAFAQTTPAKAPSRGTVVVKASGTLAVNVGPKFELKINGTSYGLVEVRSSTARDYSFVLRNPVPAGAKIEVVYRNDYLRDGQDRNLFVDSVTINGLTLSSSSTGVVFDQGAGAQAFDNLNTIPGKREMTNNGALRFIWPSAIGGPVVIGGGNGGSGGSGNGGGSTCTALPNTTTDVVCPTGFTGIYQRFQTFDATPGVCRYVATTDNLSTKCKPTTTPTPTPTPTPTCTSQPTITTTLNCPTGFTGTFTRTQTFNSTPAVCAYNTATDNSATACKAVVNNPPTGGVGGTTLFKDRLLNADGTINWAQYDYIAANYHKEEIVNYRLGPSYADLNPGSTAIFPTVYQPEPNGLWKGGTDKALTDKVCQTSDKLVQPESQERLTFAGGYGWQMSGQMLFVPDANAPNDLKAGAANMRAFDGAGFTPLGGTKTGALCMRMRADWYPDWWNRNAISVPTTPVINRLVQRFPGLPFPAIATTRGEIQASVTGFMAFQNGVIAAAGTGNDSYSTISPATSAEPFLQLPAGKVPTALALSAMNEFLFATVWDTIARKGQLAVIAVGPADPSNVGNEDAKRYGWGVQSWPEVRSLKLLGFVDLPMVAPNAVSVSLSTGTQKFRGFDTWRGPELLTQAGRDAWYARSGLSLDTPLGDDQYWKLLASAGYAMVSSRAENKVAFVDLRPLLQFYRNQYFTSQAKWDETANGNQGQADNQWPYTFTFKPEQTPKVLGTLNINQPTAVYARKRSVDGGRAYWLTGTWGGSDRFAWVAAMDGTVRRYDVSSLIDPVRSPVLPSTPVTTLSVGANPLQVTTPITGADPSDDIYVVSRATRAIAAFTYDGKPLATLTDSRLLDPVYVTIGPNAAGFGGNGKNYALFVRTLTVLDYNGKKVHDYGMYVEPLRKLYAPQTYFPADDEQWNFLGPDGKTIQIFQYGYGNPLQGKPFMFSFDEVI